MDTKKRIKKAVDVYKGLQEIRKELDTKIEPPINTKITMLRAKMSCLEHQLATIRLLQAEDRLTQFVYKALLVGSGAILSAAVSYWWK